MRLEIARKGYGSLFATLAVACAALLAGPANAQDAFGAELYAKARAAGETKVSYYSSMIPAQFQAILPVWKKYYPAIEIQYVRGDLGQTLERVLAENRARKNIADVISSNEASFVALQQNKMLAQFASPTVSLWKEPFKSKFNGYQFPSRVLQIGFAINTNRVKPSDYPRTWQDLTKSEWKNRLGIPDPRVGGGAQMWFLTLWDKPGYGESYFNKLQANAPLIKPGILQVQQAVELGEVDVDVVAYDYSVLPARDAGKPLDFVVPSDGVILAATYDSVAANAPNPNAARLFVHLMMSKAGQEALATAYVTPVNTQANPHPKAPNNKGIPILATEPTEAQVKNLKTYIDHMNTVFKLR